MRFVLPQLKGTRPAWLVRIGLFLYDHIGGRKRLPATRRVNLKTDPVGSPLLPGFETAFEYSDCWVDDARLVVLNALDAKERGATICTQTNVAGLARRNGLWHITVDNQSDPVIARHVVNASGPSVLDVLERTVDHEIGPGEKIRLVRGSHVIVPKMFDTAQAYFCQNPDGRIFFAIPYESDFTLIGTTDADHLGSLDNIIATEEEIAYLCQSAGRYFKQPISPDDVVHSYAGVRPLVDDGSGKPETASRGYHFDVEDENGAAALLSVYGGKITTYRHLAESAVQRLVPYLPQLSGESWTANEPLPGGDFAFDAANVLQAELAAAYPFLPTHTVHRLALTYGTRAKCWLGTTGSLAGLGRDFGHGLCQAEVDYLIAQEWATNAQDILWRRTKLGLRFSSEEARELDQYVAGQVRK
jgi:glycerol-3-phosphate dehydrogenase